MYDRPDEIAIPALIIHDRDDKVADYGEGELLAHSWPQAKLYTTEGFGHRRLLSDPEVINEVMKFVASMG